MTIHERLDRLSFARLKLMALYYLISWELSTVPPMFCPTRAYGKAHLKQWRRKGTKNRRNIRKTDRSGDEISMDQLNSPTKGFVPIHRGQPTTR